MTYDKLKAISLE